MEWGSLADWVGALGGLLAVLAAVVAWAVSKRLLDVEERRDKKADAAARREQAELIFVLGAKLPGRPADQTWSIFIYNGSSKPIYDICVESQRLDGSSDNREMKLGALPPGRFVIPSHPAYYWGSPIDLDRSPETIEYLVKGKGLGMIKQATFRDAERNKWELTNGTGLKAAD